MFEFQEVPGQISPVPDHDGTECLKWDPSLWSHADHFKVCQTMITLEESSQTFMTGAVWPGGACMLEGRQLTHWVGSWIRRRQPPSHGLPLSILVSHPSLACSIGGISSKASGQPLMPTRAA